MVQDDLGDFGDARLRRAGARLLEAMSEQPTMCVHALAKDRNVTLVFQGAARTRDQARMIAKEILLSGHVKGGRAVSWGSPWAEELGQNASLDLVRRYTWGSQSSVVRGAEEGARRRIMHVRNALRRNTIR